MYFSKLPKVNYGFHGANNSVEYRKTAVDITSRVKIAEYVSLYRNNFSDYVILDEERPDTLAYKLYEKADLHWIFFLANNMINPYESWPRSTKELKSHIDEKYKGTSIFVPDIWKPRLDDAGDYEYSIIYTPLERITDPYKEFLKRDLTNSELFQIYDATEVKVFIEGKMYETKINKINSDFYEIRVDTKGWPSNSSPTNSFIFYEIVNYGEKFTVRSPITRIIPEGRYSVHNFLVNGEYRDPKQSFKEGSSEYESSPYNHFIHPLTSEAINDGLFSNPQEDTFADVFAIQGSDRNYLNSSFYITNEYYELEQNEKKRRIKVPKPQLVQSVISSMEEIFKKNRGSLI